MKAPRAKQRAFRGVCEALEFRVLLSSVACEPVEGDENEPPFAMDDLFTILVDTPLEGNLFLDNGLGEDFDDDCDTLRMRTSPLERASHGKLDLDSDGSFTYTPDAGFTGEDYFVYEVRDGKGGVDEAEVIITVVASLGPAERLDVDANHNSNPFQDAMLLFAWMSPGTPDAVLTNFVAANANTDRDSAAEVRAYLDELHGDSSALDVNGDGVLNPFQDAILAFAWMSSGTPNSVFERFKGSAVAPRDSAEGIKSYLDTLTVPVEATPTAAPLPTPTPTIRDPGDSPGVSPLTVDSEPLVDVDSQPALTAAPELNGETDQPKTSSSVDSSSSHAARVGSDDASSFDLFWQTLDTFQTL